MVVQGVVVLTDILKEEQPNKVAVLAIRDTEPTEVTHLKIAEMVRAVAAEQVRLVRTLKRFPNIGKAEKVVMVNQITPLGVLILLRDKIQAEPIGMLEEAEAQLNTILEV
jgi:hypothetical protein